MVCGLLVCEKHAHPIMLQEAVENPLVLNATPAHRKASTQLREYDERDVHFECLLDDPDCVA
jgi:hypothetical protein